MAKANAMKIKPFIKRQKLTEWIQVICSILLVIAAFWALFSWKKQKEYDVEILAISSAPNHFQTFVDIYVLSYEGLSDDADEEISAFVNENKELVKQFPDIVSTLIGHKLVAENKRKYRTDYELMLEHCNIVLSTLKEQRSRSTLYQFYRYLNIMARKTDSQFELFELDLNHVIANNTLSFDQRRKLMNNMLAQTQDIADTREDIKANIMSLHEMLVKIRDF